MKTIFLKSNKDKKSFKIFESFGAESKEIENLDKTDDTLKTLIQNNYKTIVMTSEVAGFSESIIKKYNKRDDIKIIIAPPKNV